MVCYSKNLLHGEILVHHPNKEHFTNGFLSVCVGGWVCVSMCACGVWVHLLPLTMLRQFNHLLKPDRTITETWQTWMGTAAKTRPKRQTKSDQTKPDRTTGYVHISYIYVAVGFYKFSLCFIVFISIFLILFYLVGFLLASFLFWQWTDGCTHTHSLVLSGAT